MKRVLTQARFIFNIKAMSDSVLSDFQMSTNDLQPLSVIDKWGCRQIVLALESYGITDAVVSPGSRNAPLIASLNRCRSIRLYSVIDERSAGFVALGIAKIKKKSVALVCTSGTALLNFAPAVAEAFYSGVPLIVISANRPYEIVNQMDGQTIVQPGALSNFVKGCFTVDGDNQTEKQQWKNNVALNDALQLATSQPVGPVHIDVPLSAPLTPEIPAVENEAFRRIELFAPASRLDHLEARKWARELADKRVLIVAGMLAPDGDLNKALTAMARLNNIVVIAEPLANLHGDSIIDATPGLCSRVRTWIKTADESEQPEIVIVCGGPIVNEDLKAAIHRVKSRELWFVGVTHNLTDTFKHLTRRVEYSPAGFFPYIAGALGHINRVKAKENRQLNVPDLHSVFNTLASQVATIDTVLNFNALDALSIILKQLPGGWNLQVSNGMAIRYLSILPFDKFHRIDCNRGVNGIDGSASTALGASTVYSAPTLLIIGDMSLQYDIAALSSRLISDKFKIIVLANGEGGIFRNVATTRTLPENESFIACKVNLPLSQLAAAYGFDYMQVSDYAACVEAADLLQHTAPVIIELKTSTTADLEAFNSRT